MKIIVIGAGIGGLSTYLSLKKHLAGPTITIKLVESHTSPTQQARFTGAGLGLGPSGLRAMNSFSPGAVKLIRERGFPVTELTLRNAEGELLNKLRLDSQERYGFETLMLPRALVHQALLQDVEFGAIHWGTTVLRVRECGARIAVDCVDGSTEMADLVIGADGIRSAVKRSLFKGRYQPKYSGMVSTGGFIELRDLPQRFQDAFPTEGMAVTLGRNGLLGYSMASPSKFEKRSSSVTPPIMQWWAIYRSPEIPSRKKRVDTIKYELLKRYGSWKTPYDIPDCGTKGFPTTCASIIDRGCQQLPHKVPSPPSELPSYQLSASNVVFTSEPFAIPLFDAPRLPHWSNASTRRTPSEARGRIVLIGDAAHNTSQYAGNHCAVEDAVVYATLLGHYLSLERGKPSSDALSKATKAYEAIRKPRVHRIMHKAKHSAGTKEMSRFGGMMREFAIKRLLSRIPQSATDKLFAYDAEAEAKRYLSNGRY